MPRSSGVATWRWETLYLKKSRKARETGYWRLALKWVAKKSLVDVCVTF